MKKIITILAAVLCFTAALNAQPRAIGGRLNTTGIQVSYEHGMGGSNFIEFNGGLDLGWDDEDPGFIASGIYNFMLAQPDWCRGEWGIYAGPGAYAGYLSDKIYYGEGSYHDYGFSIGITGQIGLEYTFWFPLQLSVDIRPYLGLHFYNDPEDKLKIGNYNDGLRGFIPTVSVRYRF